MPSEGVGIGAVGPAGASRSFLRRVVLRTGSVVVVRLGRGFRDPDLWVELEIKARTGNRLVAL